MSTTERHPHLTRRHVMPIRHPSERLEEANELVAGAMDRFDHLHEAAVAKDKKEKVKTAEDAENAEIGASIVQRISSESSALSAVKSHAPWNDETIARLNAHQHDDRFHPYTCGYDSRHILVATREGWKCPECDYTQNWAHT